MKKLLFTILFILIISCGSNKGGSESKRVENKALVEQLFTHFNNHDWEAMSKMYIPISEFKDPSLGPGIVLQTREQTRKKYAALNEVFPDIRDSIVALYPSGQNVMVVEFIASGTFPDNSKFELPICGIITIENGLITKDYAYFDNFDENQ